MANTVPKRAPAAAYWGRHGRWLRSSATEVRRRECGIMVGVARTPLWAWGSSGPRQHRGPDHCCRYRGHCRKRSAPTGHLHHCRRCGRVGALPRLPPQAQLGCRGALPPINVVAAVKVGAGKLAPTVVASATQVRWSSTSATTTAVVSMGPVDLAPAVTMRNEKRVRKVT
jgi:hypothetical protein